ncbi:ATP-binding cassette domain-containing protein [Lysinibacillus sp. NPDC056959]|uniref:ABC transporter ATP-binding protein/permease n=1 Tax=Lysinibacillus sp. NPDC056959 TaxID=3345981 RepID=UPI00362C7115
MLKLIDIKKVYKTETLEQIALHNVSISFRKNEFVSILGPSGSGKTTLLNIIGGLDQYTSGDLIINGASSKSFKSEDWDAYRNNSVGFIFQSYNLISHLSIRDNVEMGMKLSGISTSERRKKAEDALIKVGLKDHIEKRPNQLSGGQMQRVAIARAIANDPEIILADEPTGALDTETSIQVMEIIKELAKEKLVIMVTHNPELAEEYSDRIVRFKDGQLIEDTNPVLDSSITSDYKLKHTSMSFFTALKSSGKNVLSKKWRTALTSFASSVGIIGVALVLSLSNGFSNQIDDFQTEMLSSLPITVSDGPSTSIIPSPPTGENGNTLDEFPTTKKMYVNAPSEDETTKTHTNVLTDEYVDYVYKLDSELVSSYSLSRSVELPVLKLVDGKATKLNTTNLPLTTYPSEDTTNSTTYLEENYDLLAGDFPKSESELLLVVDSYNQLDVQAANELGLTDDVIKLSSLIGKEFKLLSNDQYYVKNGDTFRVNGNPSDLSTLYNDKNSQTLNISGVIRIKEDAQVKALSTGLLYSDALNEHFIAEAQQSEIVLAQEKADYNVLTGEALGEETSPSTQLPEMDPTAMTSGDFTKPLTKDATLAKLGAISTPVSISIYPTTFEAKDSILDYLDAWNDDKAEDEAIEYTDMAEVMSSSLNTVIDTISYVLIAFASISLIVSMIMIGIIIYVSVLERTKEIGVLRALGARKKDITRLFNAETFIIGATSGILGIGITYLLSVPINIIIENLTDFSNIASLNPVHGIALIVLSIVLTMLGGLLPAKMAAKKDPVVALRNE